METFIGTIAGIVTGGIITIWASRYFYRKTVKKKALSCFIDTSSEILRFIKPEVKERLRIEFEGQEIDSLYEVQFVIANTGDISIKDPISPLRLKIPGEGTILDAQIIHIEPDGRKVDFLISDETTLVTFDFLLLNPGEYFIFKILIKGELPRKEAKKDGPVDISDFINPFKAFQFEITAEDLPPTIESERLLSEHIDGYKPRVSGEDLGMFIVILISGFFQTYLLLGLERFDPHFFLFNFSDFFSNFSFYKFTILISWLQILLGLLFVVGFIIDVSLKLRPRRKSPFMMRQRF